MSLSVYLSQAGEALLDVVRAGGDRAALEAALAAGANLHHRDYSGDNALHYAARAGHPRVIADLAALGLTDANATDSKSPHSTHIYPTPAQPAPLVTTNTPAPPGHTWV